MARKKSADVKVSYDRTSTVRTVVKLLIKNSGKGKSGYPCDRRFLKQLDSFGKDSGFITRRQLSLLGCMYNRIIGGGMQLDWDEV